VVIKKGQSQWMCILIRVGDSVLSALYWLEEQQNIQHLQAYKTYSKDAFGTNELENVVGNLPIQVHVLTEVAEWITVAMIG